MTEAALLPSDVGAALELQELTYAWQGFPLTPEITRELELMVARALQVAGTLQLTWTAATRDGSIWEPAAYARRMRAIEFLTGIVTDILSRTQENLRQLRGRYPESAEIPGAANVGPSLKATQDIAAGVQKIVKRLNRPMPPVNEEMLQRSRESLDRGEGERIADIIARLETSGPLVKE